MIVYSRKQEEIGVDVVDVGHGHNWDALIAERHWFVCGLG